MVRTESNCIGPFLYKIQCGFLLTFLLLSLVGCSRNLNPNSISHAESEQHSPALEPEESDVRHSEGDAKWLVAFPDFEGFERIIHPPFTSEDGEITRLMATYEKNGEHVATIMLEKDPGRARNPDYRKGPKVAFRRVEKIGEHTAYRFYPQCGNDPNLARLVVILGDDRYFSFSGRTIAFSMQQTIETLNFARINELIDDLPKP